MAPLPRDCVSKTTPMQNQALLWIQEAHSTRYAALDHELSDVSKLISVL
jgi:hypothetical protein